MAVGTYFKNVAGAILAPVAKSLWGINPNLSMGLSMLNERVFKWDISGYSAYNNKIFYTGANIIVRKMVEAPITFNRKKEKPKRDTGKYYSKGISNPERATIKAGALDELPDHELSGMFTIETMESFWHFYNFGSGVLWFEQLDATLSRNSKPIAVHALRPDRINIVRNNGRFDNIERYDYTTLNGEILPLPKESVLIMRHWNPNWQYRLNEWGLDYICAKDIALNDAGNEAEGAAYVNGGRGTLFSGKVDITSEGAAKTKFTSQQVASLRDTIQHDMQGARNNRRMHFTNGEVVVTPYGDTLAEMEISKSEDTRWKNIFAIMGIPKELSPATFSSSENSVDAGYKALVTNLVISELRKFDQKLTRLIDQWWPGIVAVSDLTEYSELAPDLKLMKEVYGEPEISVDERRKIFGHDDLGGAQGAAILVNSGKILLSDIIDPMETDIDPEAL